MKIFKGFNKEGKCLVCDKNDDKPCTLIGVVGSEDGHIMRAEAVHVDCINLYYYPDDLIIAQKL